MRRLAASTRWPIERQPAMITCNCASNYLPCNKLMRISAGHLVPAGNFCQPSRTSRKLLPAISYQPDNFRHRSRTSRYCLPPPEATTISYWYEMVEKRVREILGTRCLKPALNTTDVTKVYTFCEISHFI